MPIASKTIRQLLEQHLREEEIEQLLQGLDATAKAKLLHRLTEQLRRSSALAEVANGVSDSLSLDVLFPRVMEIVTKALNADRSSLFLYDAETDELFSRELQGDSIGEIRFPSNVGVAGSVFTRGKPEIITDAYDDPHFNREVDLHTGYHTRNMLCVPMRNKKGDVIGITQALNKHAGDFDAEDQHLLEAISLQASAALENARLFEKAERQQREEAMLLEISISIASEIHLDPLLTKILAAATTLLEADRGTLFLYDPASDELFSRIAGGIDSEEIRFPATAGIAGECFSRGEAINIEDAYCDPRFNPEFDQHTGYRTHSMLSMPIIAKGQHRIGVMQILNRKGGPFNSADERRLRAFSAQAAIAIENAQLFDEVSAEHDYNEAVLHSMSNAVLTLDADGVLRKANEAARRILHRTDMELVGHRLDDLFHGRNDFITKSLARVRASGTTDITVDVDLLVEGSDAVSVNLVSVPLVSTRNEPIGYMLMLEDITREKRLRNTMSRYMSKTVVDKLMDSGEAELGGTGREVSVLFSDIRGFTSISERLGAKETVALLNEYFTDMVDIVFAHDGVLDKYIGDMIMAVFGSVLQSEQDASNAVTVGNKMMAALHDLNGRRIARGSEPIRIGVGISTGHVVAGNIGSLKRMEYTVIGDRVNLAERLQAANKFYGTSILLCDATWEAVKDNATAREIDLIRVRGMNTPVAIYEALGHHSEESFPHRSEVLETFSKGLVLYRQREWSKAERCFRQALAAHPDDGPSRVYLERCRIYRDEPPPTGWDGVWTVHQHK